MICRDNSYPRPPVKKKKNEFLENIWSKELHVVIQWKLKFLSTMKGELNAIKKKHQKTYDSRSDNYMYIIND